MNPFVTRPRNGHPHALQRPGIPAQVEGRIAGRGHAADSLDTMCESVRFIRVDVRGHNEREEQHIFPEIERVLPACDHAAVMTLEHRARREHPDRLDDLLAKVATSSPAGVLGQLSASATAVAPLPVGHNAWRTPCFSRRRNPPCQPHGGNNSRVWIPHFSVENVVMKKTIFQSRIQEYHE